MPSKAARIIRAEAQAKRAFQRDIEAQRRFAATLTYDELVEMAIERGRMAPQGQAPRPGQYPYKFEGMSTEELLELRKEIKHRLALKARQYRLDSQ